MVNARLNDEELEEWLEGKENQSETIREALRRMRDSERNRDFPELTDAQERSYNFLVEERGVGAHWRLEVIKSRLAQLTSLKKDAIRWEILGPLSNEGLVRVNRTLWEVEIVVMPPPGTDVEEATAEAAGEARGASRESAGVSEQWEKLEAASALGGPSDD